MAGILDQLDPQTQGVLAAAFAGLQASGPSRMPVSLGQVIGQGGQAGLTQFDATKRLESELEARDVATKRAKMDLALQEQAVGGAGIMGDPDKVEALGTRLALGGHPGGAALIAVADRMRTKRAAAQQLGALQTQPGTAADTSQEGTGSFDMSGTAGPAVAGGSKGIFGGLMASPYVGDEAKAMQGVLDRAPAGVDPETWLKHYERLRGEHKSGVELDQKAADRAAEQIQRQDDKKAFAQFAAGIAASNKSPHYVVGVDEGTGKQVVTAFSADGKGILGTFKLDTTAPAAFTGSAVTDRQERGKYQQSVAKVEQPLLAYQKYEAARGTVKDGENVPQAYVGAAESMIQMLRSNKEFKGEVDRMLGGGNVVQRIENSISKGITGKPTKEVLDDLDRLAGAIASASAENYGSINRRYYNDAKQRGGNGLAIVGAPKVYGSFVILPTGESRRFASPAKAAEVADAWTKENGKP